MHSVTGSGRGYFSPTRGFVTLEVIKVFEWAKRNKKSKIGELGRAFLEITRGFYLVKWTCATCGQKLHYPAIKMPVARPEVSETEAFLMHVEYRSFCIDCVVIQAKTFKTKVENDEFTPQQCWVPHDKEAQLLSLVPIDNEE